MTTRLVLHASSAQRAKLRRLKINNAHLETPGNGLMINDAETVAIIEQLAARLGTSKREVVRQALLAELSQ